LKITIENPNLADLYPEFANMLTYKHYDAVPDEDHFRLIVNPRFKTGELQVLRIYMKEFITA